MEGREAVVRDWEKVREDGMRGYDRVENRVKLKSLLARVAVKFDRRIPPTYQTRGDNGPRI